eukprot:scaffold114357_cov81-Cyclotella_meneghiniana.AAC.8
MVLRILLILALVVQCSSSQLRSQQQRRTRIEERHALSFGDLLGKTSPVISSDNASSVTASPASESSNTNENNGSNGASGMSNNSPHAMVGGGCKRKGGCKDKDAKSKKGKKMRGSIITKEGENI